MSQPPSEGALNAFSLPVRTWFAETFGQSTSPQTQGWPPIQDGQHTLILAPTGSGNPTIKSSSNMA